MTVGLRAMVGWAGTWLPGEHQNPLLGSPFNSDLSKEWRPSETRHISDVVPSMDLADCVPYLQVNGVRYPLAKHPTKTAWWLFDHSNRDPRPRTFVYRFGSWYLQVGPGDVVTLTVRNPTGFPIDGGVQLFGVDALEDDSWQDS